METRPKYFYPSIVVAAMAVTLFSLIGIASMTGMLPLAHSSDEPAIVAAERPPAAEPRSAPQRQPAPKAEPRRAQRPPVARGETSPESAAAPPMAALPAVCGDCGKVEAINAVERKGEGSGLGAVAGGVAGALLGNQFGKGNGRTAMTIAGSAGGAYLGNQIEQNARGSTVYRIHVRMDDGTLRTMEQNQVPNVAVGQQVRVVNQAVVPAS